MAGIALYCLFNSACCQHTLSQTSLTILPDLEVDTMRTLPKLSLLALLTTYVVWGSTYLAIHLALVSFPPFLLMASRFCVAGVLLFGWLKWRGAPSPSLRQWRDAMFAAQWFIVFGPLLLFWAGAWLRRSHSLAMWVAVGVLLTFSIAVSLVGATGPLPRDGFDRYTAAGALGNLLHPPSATETATTLADR